VCVFPDWQQRVRGIEDKSRAEIAELQSALLQSQATADTWRRQCQSYSQATQPLAPPTSAVRGILAPLLLMSSTTLLSGRTVDIRFAVHCKLHLHHRRSQNPGGETAFHTSAGHTGVPIDTSLELEQKISRAIASVPEWRQQSPAKVSGDTADLVHRVAVTEALLDAAKTTLQERTLQVAVLIDSINALQAALDGSVDCDCECDCGAEGQPGAAACDGCQRASGADGQSSQCAVQYAALSRRVVELTAQVVSLAKGAPTTASFDRVMAAAGEPHAVVHCAVQVAVIAGPPP
jgi:hypothetical protein